MHFVRVHAGTIYGNSAPHFGVVPYCWWASIVELKRRSQNRILSGSRHHRSPTDVVWRSRYHSRPTGSYRGVSHPLKGAGIFAVQSRSHEFTRCAHSVRAWGIRKAYVILVSPFNDLWSRSHQHNWSSSPQGIDRRRSGFRAPLRRLPLTPLWPTGSRYGSSDNLVRHSHTSARRNVRGAITKSTLQDSGLRPHPHGRHAARGSRRLAQGAVAPEKGQAVLREQYWPTCPHVESTTR